MIRIVIAGVVGGIVVFVWSFLSHVILPLGATGLHTDALPGEAALLNAMKENIPESGMYFIPGMDLSITDAAARQEAVAAKMKANPVAFLVIQKEGAEGMMPRQLISEFVANIFCALLAAIILAEVGSGYFMRVIIVTLLGLFAWLAVDVSHWIWYAFPSDYAMAQGVDHVVGWFAAGLVLAAIVKSRKVPEPATVTP